jgi:hypothetical protein
MRILVARRPKTMLTVIRLAFARLEPLGSWIDSEGVHNPSVATTLVSGARIAFAQSGEKE